MRCKALGTDGNNEDGMPCNRHRQCRAGFCDKRGRYGARFRCTVATSKVIGGADAPDTDDGGSDSLREFAPIIAAGAALIAAAVIVAVVSRR